MNEQASRIAQQEGIIQAQELEIAELQRQLKSEQAKLDSFITENADLQKRLELAEHANHESWMSAIQWKAKFNSLEKLTRNMREAAQQLYEGTM